MKRVDLPYFDKRNAKIDMIVIHAVAYDAKGAIESFKRHEVSPHYLIDEKGNIYQFVSDDKCAWHAGQSFWKGQEHLNYNSIGIELCTQSFGQDDFPFAQISALIRLCRHLKRKYHIKKERVIGHSDIAPVRKADPGKAFPWGYFSRHGLGAWYDVKNAKKVQLNDEKELLSQIGYDVSDFKAAKVAFVRHFMGRCVAHDSLENLLEKPFETQISVDNQDYLSVLKAVFYAFHKAD